MNEMSGWFGEVFDTGGLDFSNLVIIISMLQPFIALLAGLVGFWLLFDAVAKDLRTLSEQSGNSMVNQGNQGGVSSFLLKTISGLALISFMTSLSVLTNVFYGDSGSSLHYADPSEFSESGGYKYAMAVGIMFIQMMGMIWIFKAFVKMAYLGEQNQSGDGMKAILHLFGGVLVMNIVTTVGVLWWLVGLPNPLAFL